MTVAFTGGEARRFAGYEEYDIVIVNAPLSDEFGTELACMFAQDSASGVVLLIKNDLFESVSDKVSQFGVFTVPKPLSENFLYQVLRVASAARVRLMGLKRENVKLKVKIEEMRLVDRAKCALVKYLNMTEPMAHRYIEKQAMDLRTTRKNIAENIIKTYEM